MREEFIPFINKNETSKIYFEHIMFIEQSLRKIVIFTEEESSNTAQSKMSTDEALHILNKYKGSIKTDLNAKEERLAHLDEKYGDAD